jgi:creatinine amidohydrolase
VTIHRLERMFPAELEARVAAQPLLLLPIGTIEWHSHHLPVGLDGLVATGLCERLAQATGGVLAPTTWWAVGGVPFPWTVDLPPSLIEPLLAAGFAQFGAMGFRVIVAWTGHFGRDQTAALKRAAATAMADGTLLVLPLTPYDLVSERWTGDHAGIGEASLLWALDEELVRLDAVQADAPLPGVIGDDPRGAASRALGEELIALMVERASALACRLLEASPVERAAFAAAVQASADVLGAINALRATGPASAVPPLMTPTWLAHCQAFSAGDFDAARAHATRRLDDLWA